MDRTPIQTGLLLGLLAAGVAPAQRLADTAPAHRLAGICNELTTGEPDRARILEIGRLARSSRYSVDRQAVLGALLGHERRLRETAFPVHRVREVEALAEGDLSRYVRTSMVEPCPRIRATWIARRTIELGVDPTTAELVEDLESEVLARKYAALLVARDERALLGELAGPLESIVRQVPPRARAPLMPAWSAVPEREALRCLGAQTLLETDPDPELTEEALTVLLEKGTQPQREFALRSLALCGTPDPRIRWKVISLLAARSASDEELCAALLALSAVGIVPRSEWPPPRATLRRWLRSRASTPEQRATARQYLAWNGPRDQDALPAVQALASDPRHPRAATIARDLLPRLRRALDH